MKMVICVALLSGYLVTELKEFLILGGASNAIAFSLLKIVICMFLIGLTIRLTLFPEMISTTFKKLNIGPKRRDEHIVKFEDLSSNASSFYNLLDNKY